MDFEKCLENYAELTVKVGLNVQPGETVWINTSLHQPEFVRLVVRKAYEAGAKLVQVEWVDDEVTRLRYKLAPEDSFAEYPQWRADAITKVAAEGGAYLLIESRDPDLLSGTAPSRTTAFQKAAGAALAKWREYTFTDRATWSIIAAPSVAWAEKVFPELKGEAAVRALWEAIFRATRADQEDPVAAWKAHNGALNERIEQLNAKQFKKLHYRAPGTKLTVALPDRHIWSGGKSANAKGNDFNANVPTEEVFISPHREGTEGYVTSTKPLSYNGNLIENFTLTFEKGRVVDFKAEKGYESLKALIELDEGSHYLGEAALVQHNSPISNSNLIFFNTLFDENASNHLAIGRAFSSSVEGGADLSPQELAALGLNESLTHVDFMIGSAEMDIDGELADGTLEPVFRSGNWALI
ncbi:aminopeptidase [Gorillibacterium timonense]|uniref:aminopeptidase n=1 Tax=Gorillibacterium timonense TaxID=1689269 RepID=UPI00071DF3DC|nr:aminopeptidase [Gorillibacterium timonense]